MVIKQTSLDSWDVLQKTLGSRQYAVLEALQALGSANNREIAEYLELPINQITPRTNELVKENLVVQDKIIVDSETHRKTIYWRLK